MSATTHAAGPLDPCNAQLDSAVDLYLKGNTPEAKSSLKDLAKRCSQLPQVHHNLGVIAGDEQDWETAQQYFQRAIANDARTSMTMSHLHSIHQYRSALAYQQALQTKNKIASPNFEMQSSATVNANSAEPNALRDITTIEYELFAWWSSASDKHNSEWLDHYTDGYQPADNTNLIDVDWEDISRNISFTAQDAVAVLSYHHNEQDKRMLLLLRLHNERWKIYKEETL